MSLKLPGSPQNLFKKGPAPAGRFPVDTVVAAHDCLHTSLFHKPSECRKVGLRHVFLCRPGIKAVADRLRSRVHREMLGTGSCLHVFTVSLKASDKRAAKRSRQIRIFPVGLLPSSPPWIPEDIHIRRPEGQSLVDVSVSHCSIGIVFGPALRGDDIPNLLH